MAAISMLALLLTASGASAAHARRKTPVKCVPGHSRQITANTQAQVYEATVPHGFPEYLGAWGCVYGHSHPYFLGPLPYGADSTEGGGGIEHEMLAGPVVAYGEVSIEDGHTEWHAVVRDLRTGRVLHRVPTGAPLEPKPRYVGVGSVVAIAVKSDGAVAWIADDDERSATAHGTGLPYFDVYAVDKSGTRLLAAGTEIDPSSLALSVGGSNIGQGSLTAPGSTLYWTQGGKPASATLN
jgi:hypothetical protein